MQRLFFSRKRGIRSTARRSRRHANGGRGGKSAWALLQRSSRAQAIHGGGECGAAVQLDIACLNKF